MSLSLEDSERRMRALREETGRGNWDFVTAKFRRERLRIQGREAREHFAPSVYWNLYARQRGTCPWCRQELEGKATDHAIDHFDPNKAKGFNSKSNLRLLHRKCNGEKSAKSIHQQAKETGRTYTQLIGDWEV